MQFVEFSMKASHQKLCKWDMLPSIKHGSTDPEHQSYISAFPQLKTPCAEFYKLLILHHTLMLHLFL